MDETFRFEAELWEYGGTASWVFVTLPIDVADEIADVPVGVKAFGSIRVEGATM